MCHTSTVNLYAPQNESFGFTENVIGNKYRVQSRKIADDCLDVYIVTDIDGKYFEAQAFSPIAEMPRGREGLRNARRRRMKRIARSSNFAGEFEHGGRRFLVSYVRRND